MNVLVTGIAGFVGAHLVDFLRAEVPGVRLTGWVRPGWPVPAGLAAKATLLEVELEQPDSVAAALERVPPERIVHLAAQSSPQESWTDASGTWRTNVLGLLHVVEVLRQRGLTPRTLVVGSSEEYGLVDPAALPVSEEAPLHPVSPYASSKVAQGYLALQYALGARLPLIRTRTFHHTGPGRGAAFAESTFARQIAAIEAGQQPPVVEVGNLEAIRDFSDVRDVVRAYWLLLERGEAGAVYNVCSGRPTRIREVLDTLVAQARVPVQVHVDPARLRPLEVPALVGDNGLLRRVTGWAPRIPLTTTLADLLDSVRGSA